MKKKIKDLTLEEAANICFKIRSKEECNNGLCPLYDFCFSPFWSYCDNEVMYKREVEIEEDAKEN